jgi:Flp pilus assembly protein TadG
VHLAFSRLGSAAIEYALVLPALLLFTFGAIDIGRLLWTQTTLDRAVEAAARCGAINALTCGTAAQIRTYAVNQAYGLAVTSGAFAVTNPVCGVRVTATSSFTFIIPWIATQTIPLAATSCYPQ